MAPRHCKRRGCHDLCDFVPPLRKGGRDCCQRIACQRAVAGVQKDNKVDIIEGRSFKFPYTPMVQDDSLLQMCPKRQMSFVNLLLDGHL